MIGICLLYKIHSILNKITLLRFQIAKLINMKITILKMSFKKQHQKSLNLKEQDIL